MRQAFLLRHLRRCRPDVEEENDNLGTRWQLKFVELVNKEECRCRGGHGRSSKVNLKGSEEVEPDPTSLFAPKLRESGRASRICSGR